MNTLSFMLDEYINKFNTDINFRKFVKTEYVKKVPDFSDYYWLEKLIRELLKEFEEKKMKLSRPDVDIGNKVIILDCKEDGYHNRLLGKVVKKVEDGIIVDVDYAVLARRCHATQWKLIKRGRPKKKKLEIDDIHPDGILEKEMVENRKIYGGWQPQMIDNLIEENAKLKQRIEELEKPVACKHKFIIKDFNNNPVYNFVAVCKKCLLKQYI